MEDLFTKLTLDYGLLGLGWLVAAVLWKRNTTLQDRMLQAAVEINGTLTLLAERLKT